MKIQKVNWAGIKIDCGDKTILIDAVENFKPYFPLLGNPCSFSTLGNSPLLFIKP